MPKSTPRWAQALRETLKGQVGQGWRVHPVRGKAFLTVELDDGQRVTKQLSHQWDSSSTVAVLETCTTLKNLMLEQQLGLADAYDLISSDNGAALKAKEWNWPQVVQRFKELKISSGEISDRTWHRNYRLKIDRALQVLHGNPKPTSAKELMEKLIKRWKLPAGSTGRRLQIQYVARLLEFAVQECGAPSRWLPPDNKTLRRYIGTNTAKEPTTPISDLQISSLLESIDDPLWRQAIGLVACFGLRGVELGHISVQSIEPPVLHCSYRKRVSRKPEGTDPRDIVGLDPVGLKGLSKEVLQKLQEMGASSLPIGCRLAEGAGDALGDFLKDHPKWRELRAETAAKARPSGRGNNLDPKSFRHAYNYRGEDVYGISDRVLAQMMGHSITVHRSAYSSHTDASVIQSVAARVALVSATAAA